MNFSLEDFPFWRILFGTDSVDGARYWNKSRDVDVEGGTGDGVIWRKCNFIMYRQFYGNMINDSLARVVAECPFHNQQVVQTSLILECHEIIQAERVCLPIHTPCLLI